MSFLKYDSTVKVQTGYFCFHTITEFRGVSWKSIEENNLTGTYQLNSPINVHIEGDNVLPVDSVKYLGTHSLSKILFQNGSEIIIHKKQQLSSVNIKILGDVPVWKTVEDIHQLIIDDQEIGIELLEGSLQIKEILLDVEEGHVYSLDVNPTTVFYIQNNIKVR